MIFFPFFFPSQHGICASAVTRFGLVVTRCSFKPRTDIIAVFHTDCLLCSGRSVIMSQAQTFLPFPSQYIPSSILPNNWGVNPVWKFFCAQRVGAAEESADLWVIINAFIYALDILQRHGSHWAIQSQPVCAGNRSNPSTQRDPALFCQQLTVISAAGLDAISAAVPSASS